MAIYSHSKIASFESCKYKYKLQYIDKIKPEIPSTIEAFLGNMVHKVLEKLYKDLQYQKLISEKDLLKFYETIWAKNYTNKIIIVKNNYSAKKYKEMGKKYICDYYHHFVPFNQTKTIGLETRNLLDLSDGNKYHIRIDRLSCDNKGTYFVCDYKTSSKLKQQKELDEDRQLAMYCLWVKNNFNDCKNIKLVWHFLAFDRVLTSIRTDEEFIKIENQITNLIKKIQECQKFEPNVSALCNWCGYKNICPGFGNKIKIEQRTLKNYYL